MLVYLNSFRFLIRCENSKSILMVYVIIRGLSPWPGERIQRVVRSEVMVGVVPQLLRRWFRNRRVAAFIPCFDPVLPVH